MRFRGRLIGSRTYTYSLSTNPTIRVLIFTPCVISQHPPLLLFFLAPLARLSSLLLGSPHTLLIVFDAP